MTRDDSKTHGYILASLLAAVCFIVYWNTLSNGFVYDDNGQILRNPWITDFRYLPKIFTTDSFGFMEGAYRTNTYRPMLFTVYSIEHALFGLKPWGWHLMNIIFHAANSVMVFYAISLLLGVSGVNGLKPALRHLSAFSGALIFAVHPANSEAVAWVGCVPELMYTFLCLASFCLHVSAVEDLKAVRPSLVKRSLSVFFFFLAALFKETAAALPVFIIVYDYLMRGDEKAVSVEKVKRYLPYFLAGVLYLLIRFYAVGGVAPGYRMHGYLTGFQHILNIFPLFLKYLWTLVLPLGYHPIQPLDPVFSLTEPRAFASALITLVLALSVFIFRKRIHPILLFSSAVVVVPLLPGLYAYSVSITPFSDRYLYLPVFGLGLAVSFASSRAAALKGRAGAFRAVTAFFIAASVFYSILSAGRNAVWRDDMSLWSASYAGSSENYIAIYSLGDIYLKKGMTEEALPRLNEALRLNLEKSHPDLSTLYLTRKSLAEAYSKKGDETALMAEYAEILRIKPDDVFVNYNLAVLYQGRAMFDDAIKLYARALGSATKPRQKRDILNNTGMCYASLGRLDEAASSYREALKYSPDDPVVLKNLKASESGTR